MGNLIVDAVELVVCPGNGDGDKEGGGGGLGSGLGLCKSPRLKLSLLVALLPGALNPGVLPSPSPSSPSRTSSIERRKRLLDECEEFEVESSAEKLSARLGEPEPRRSGS